MKRTISYLSVALVFLVAGCAEDSVGAGSAPPPFADEQPSSDWLKVTGSVNTATLDAAVDKETSHEQVLNEAMAAVGFLDRALGTTDDWRTAESNMAQLLASDDAAANPEIERFGTVALLRAHLLRTDDPEALPFVQKYTERLIEMRSEETETMAAGLERLQGHVSPQTMASLASQAVAVGAEWNAECGNCDENVMGAIGENKQRVEPVRFDRSVSMASLRTITASAD